MGILNLEIRRERLFPASELVVLLILLLSFMDFHLYSLHLMVVAFLLWCFLKGRLRVVNGIVPPLVLTVVLFFFWSADFFSPTAWMKRLVWPAAFLLGYNLVQPASPNLNNISKAEKKAQVCFFIAVLGFFIHLLLNIYANRNVETANRNTIDFWTTQNRAATGQAGLMCVPMAWCVAYIIGENKLKKRLPAILAIIIMLYYNMTLGSRTVVISLAVLICVAIYCTLKAERNVKRKSRTPLIVAAVGMFVMLIYNNDIGGIRTLIEKSVLGERMFSDIFELLFDDPRWEAKLEYIKLMPQHPFGGSNILKTVGQYAHDVLLDTYDEAGMFAFLAVVALLWDAGSKLLCLLRSKHISFNTRMTVLCIYVAMFLEFSIEPVFAGMPWLLMTLCFFHGIVTNLVKNAHLQVAQRANF